MIKVLYVIESIGAHINGNDNKWKVYIYIVFNVYITLYTHIDMYI